MTHSRRGRSAEIRIAYLSMEIGLESRLPTYSGGLGVLSGDTLRASADLALPMVGVSLVHREGYFRQHLDADGRQTESPSGWSPEDELEEAGPRFEVHLEGRPVHLRAFRYDVAGVGGASLPVYLLDADVPENAEEDRALTDHLYGGDSRYRLKQEAILGIGGAALLRSLGYRKIHTFHMNEGHSALLPLALLEGRVGNRASGRVTAADDGHVRRQCVFTTHTPVPAGHDRFEESLVREVLGDRRADLLRRRGLADGVLNMTHLALHFSRFVNGVAARHAQISRQMFPERQVTAITNGVHVLTWASPPLAELFDRHLDGWRLDPLNLRHAVMLPLAELVRARAAAKVRLLDVVRSRTGRSLAPDVFTLGFARRATPYKRADLLLDDPERLRAVARRHGGLQVLYAGKAHPRDEGGKRLIRNIHEAARLLEGDVEVVWLENYDMELGGLLTSGVDLWLNNPERPKEASGTSGMKAALNGVPNLSVLDGWWIEGHIEGVTGWSIGDAWAGASDREADAEALYRKLDEVVLPLFRDDPDGYAAVGRSAIALNGSHFSTRRMMHQYVDLAYRSGETGEPVRTRRPVRAGAR